MAAQMIFTFVEPSNDAPSVVQVARYGSELPSLQESEVAVQFLASPVNPQDLLVIAGRYPVKPRHHYEGFPIPGYDGVCRVIGVGSAVDSLQLGDHAIPRYHGLGTWRLYAAVSAADLIKVPRELNVVAASLLKMGVVVAWLLLRERSGLVPGDWIVQNAASGVVAQFVSQLARMQGLHTLSVIRDRHHAESLRQRLLAVGADAVITEGELDALRGRVPCLGGKRVVLALDSVFGASGNRLVDILTEGGSFVNYGSLAGADMELHLSQRDLFWKRITFKNFRLSAALESLNERQFADLLQWLSDCFLEGKLKVPEVEEVFIAAAQDLNVMARKALAKASDKSTVGTQKQVFMFK